jgi:acyl-CoA synthetase (NDP forming)
VVVADSLEDFEDLVVLFTSLGRRPVSGWRFAAVSNAGFECVAIADSLGRFTLPPFGAETVGALEAIFVRSRIDKVVDIHNPIDLTPMTGDEAYADTVRALLEDEQYDAVVVGIVPLTAALNTLPPGAGHGEDVSRSDGIVARLAALKRAGGKPWVVVVDAGALYDPMVRALQAAGIPTFRSADRALRLLNVYCSARQRSTGAS